MAAEQLALALQRHGVIEQLYVSFDALHAPTLLAGIAACGASLRELKLFTVRTDVDWRPLIRGHHLHTLD